MTDLLKDKVALITGSGKGIGRAVAIAMAKEGARVIVNDVVPERSEAVTQEIINSGGRAISINGDISQFEAARQITEAAVSKFNRLDILVNNAGICIPAPIWDLSEENWDRTVDISLKGTFNCTRHASRIMKEQKWGRILSNTTIAFIYGSSGDCNYVAAKAGIVGFSRTVANDLKPFGVTCNVYRPYTQSEMMPKGGSQAGSHWEAAYKAGIINDEQAKDLMVDIPKIDTVPPLLVYLCTDEASNITGQVFDIRGDAIGIYSPMIKIKTVQRNTKEKGLWTYSELKNAIPELLKK